MCYLHMDNNSLNSLCSNTSVIISYFAFSIHCDEVIITVELLMHVISPQKYSLCCFACFKDCENLRIFGMSEAQKARFTV